MKNIFSFIFVLFLILIQAQNQPQPQEVLYKISAVVTEEQTFKPLANVHVLNLNEVKGTITDETGFFEINAKVNDTLHLSILGFQSVKVRVTQDWIKIKSTKIKLSEKATALDEVVVSNYKLTGYLQIDAKLVPLKENYRWGISGLNYGYETGGSNSPNAFSRVVNSIFNPADALYNLFGKKGKELKKLREMKKDQSTRQQLENKYDRELICAMLGIQKQEIPQILAKCNYSEAFVLSANDLQILDAITDCFEEYKILKKN